MAKDTLSVPVENALKRLAGTSAGSLKRGADAIGSLQNAANVDVEEVTWNEGDKAFFPKTPELWKDSQFSRTFNGREINGFALAVLDATGKPVGAKVMYYSMLRDTKLPIKGSNPDDYEFDRENIQRANQDSFKDAGANTYDTVMGCPTMQEVYDYIVNNKLGKPIECVITKEITSANTKREGDVTYITGPRKAILRGFKW